MFQIGGNTMWRVFIIFSFVLVSVISAADYKGGYSASEGEGHPFAYSTKMLALGCLGCGSVIKPFKLDKDNTPVLDAVSRLSMSESTGELRVMIGFILKAIEHWTADDLFKEAARANAGIVKGTADFSKILEALRRDLWAELKRLTYMVKGAESGKGA